MTPRLSICIPTYNRATFLSECLESVYESVSGNEQFVEIVVSDNCSTDSTLEVVESFKEKLFNIRAWSNKDNIGSELNILTAGKAGRGDYIWILGDDDKIAPNAIPTVLKYLDANTDIVICNFSSHTRLFEHVVKKRFFPWRREMRFCDRDHLLSVFGTTLGFISSVIVRRSALASADHVACKKYFEYGWSFLKILYSTLPKGCVVFYLPEAIVLNRLGNSPITNWIKVFVTGSAVLLDDLGKLGYSSAAVLKAKNIVIKQYIVNYLLNSKADGVSHGHIYRELYFYYSRCWRYWVQCLPLALIPSVMLAGIKRTVKASRALLHTSRY